MGSPRAQYGVFDGTSHIPRPNWFDPLNDGRIMTIFTEILQPKIAGVAFYILALLGAFVLRPVDGFAADPRYVRQTTGAARVIVFVHGVLGNGNSTWTAPNKAYWPDMLTQDHAFDDFDVYVYEYPTTMIGSTFSID
jgi:hypothetical protein